MKLPREGARWLVSLRWLACLILLLTIWFSSAVLRIVEKPLPLYLVAGAMLAYNLIFRRSQRNWAGGEGTVDRNIAVQVSCDLVALTLLLYFADLPRNPFLFYFTFHMIIAGMYLRGRLPHFFAGLASLLVGSVLLLEYLRWIPSFPLRYPSDRSLPDGRALDGVYLMGLFLAFASTLWIAVYFTTSIRRYVDRAHAELRQKEKLLGIGQLVAGIAHQIANPLDGLQNCLRRIGELAKNDPHVTEYLQLMVEALERIERTAKPRSGLRSAAGNRAAKHRRQSSGRGHAPGAGLQPRKADPDRDHAGQCAAGPGRPLYAAGSALQPLHERDCRDAPRRHAVAAHGRSWPAG